MCCKLWRFHRLRSRDRWLVLLVQFWLQQVKRLQYFGPMLAAKNEDYQLAHDLLLIICQKGLPTANLCNRNECVHTFRIAARHCADNAAGMTKVRN